MDAVKTTEEADRIFCRQRLAWAVGVSVCGTGCDRACKGRYDAGGLHIGECGRRSFGGLPAAFRPRLSLWRS